MELILAIILCIVFLASPTMLSAIFGQLIPILFAALGYILGVESIIAGIGGSLGCLVNFYITNSFIKQHGAMSRAPAQSRMASVLFILFFLGVVLSRQLFGFEPDKIDYIVLFTSIFLVWIIWGFLSNKLRRQSVEGFIESVTKFKIVKKYEATPKWAINLY